MITSMPEAKFQIFLTLLSDHLSGHLHECWSLSARVEQRPPEPPWLIWLLLGGRGSGKTRSGAKWIREKVQNGGKRRIALVAPTLSDAREVMLEGESGLLNIGYPQERPQFISSRRRIEWPNGAVGHVFTAEDPDGLRGPQFDCAWADEFCAWAYPEETLSNLRLGLRLGLNPQLVISTTPKPLPVLVRLMDSLGVKVTHMRTVDNTQFLSPTFVRTMQAAYGGTRRGRQELEGELLVDFEDALWTQKTLEKCRISDRPALDKVIVAVDPPVTSSQRSDKCGIIVAGRARGQDQNALRADAVILHDGTIKGASPEAWAERAIELSKSWDADYILVEVNQGGDMVRSVIGAVDAMICVKTVFATRSKTVRAEPVAALYEQGRVKHMGLFKDLEDELCQMGAKKITGVKTKSPDRGDALVWAVTDLLLKVKKAPRIRVL